MTHTRQMSSPNGPEGGSGSAVLRERLAPLVNLTHLDELQAESLDLLEDSVQRRLVLNRSAEDRLDRLDLGVEPFEAREESLAQPASDAEFVPAGLHIHHRRHAAGEGASPGQSGDSPVVAAQSRFDLQSLPLAA
jgi:hypothetical protein